PAQPREGSAAAQGELHARRRRQGGRRRDRLRAPARVSRRRARRRARRVRRPHKEGARGEGAPAGLRAARAERRGCDGLSVPILRGVRVVLRPMTISDLPLLVRWGSAPEFRWYQWGMKPGRFEEDMARKWIESMSVPGKSGCWVIEHESRPIGFANFREYKPKGRSAEIGI